MAKAQYLDAVNKLKGTENMAASAITAAIEQARATMIAAQQMAGGMTASARLTAEGLVRATTESVRAENGMFDDVTKPMFADPARKLAALNEQIIRLRRETESGIDRKTRRFLSASDIAVKTADRLTLEEEKAALMETTSKNMSDSIGVMLGTMTQGLGSLYPIGSDSIPADRRYKAER